MKKYLVSYYNAPNWYGTHINAASWEEAMDICQRHSLLLDGEYMFTLPWPLGFIFGLFNKVRSDETN